MNQPVQESGRHLLIAEDLCPLSKGEIRGQSHTGSFIAVATLINILQSSMLKSANSFRSRRSTTRSTAKSFP
jgi:hypothetical protein